MIDKCARRLPVSNIVCTNEWKIFWKEKKKSGCVNAKNACARADEWIIFRKDRAIFQNFTYYAYDFSRKKTLDPRQSKNNASRVAVETNKQTNRPLPFRILATDRYRWTDCWIINRATLSTPNNSARNFIRVYSSIVLATNRRSRNLVRRLRASSYPEPSHPRNRKRGKTVRKRERESEMDRKNERANGIGETERKEGERVTERTKFSKQQKRKKKQSKFFKVGTLVRVTLCKY